MRNLWRRDWRIDLISIVFLIVATLFATYLEGRQHLAEQRAQNTRAALCAIIDRIPLRVDSGVDKARKLDGCAKIPHPPTVFFGHPFPTPAPTVIVRPTPGPQPTVTIRPGPTSAQTSAPKPAPTRTAPPRPTPTPRPTPSRTPTPSPTPTCHRVVITVCT